MYHSASMSSWWRHQTFSTLLAICGGNSSVPGEFPAQRPVTRSFDVSFDLRLNKRLNKQSWAWWFETLLLLLWRQCNVKYSTFHTNNRTVVYKMVADWLQCSKQLSWELKFFQCHRGPLYWYGLTLIPAWISNHIPAKVWDGITYPFPNFSGCTIEVWEWISNSCHTI